MTRCKVLTCLSLLSLVQQYLKGLITQWVYQLHAGVLRRLRARRLSINCGTAMKITISKCPTTLDIIVTCVTMSHPLVWNSSVVLQLTKHAVENFSSTEYSYRWACIWQYISRQQTRIVLSQTCFQTWKSLVLTHSYSCYLCDGLCLLISSWEKTDSTRDIWAESLATDDGIQNLGITQPTSEQINGHWDPKN